MFFDVAYQSYLPALVERDQLVDGNSKLEISRSGAQLAGPALAGVLIQALKAPLAILLDAISFLVSGLFVLAIRKHEDVPEREPGESLLHGMRSELSEGLRWYVLGHRYLRWIAASTASFNFFGNVMGAIFLVYAVRQLGLSAGTIGLIFAVGNLGYLAGAITANRIATKIGGRPGHCRRRRDGACGTAHPARPGELTHPVSHRCRRDHRLRRRRLQRHAIELPPGDHA